MDEFNSEKTSDECDAGSMQTTSTVDQLIYLSSSSECSGYYFRSNAVAFVPHAGIELDLLPRAP